MVSKSKNSKTKWFKFVGVGVLGLFVLVFAISLIDSFLERNDYNYSYRDDVMVQKGVMNESFLALEELVEDDAPVIGNDAEEFEVKEYSASLETGDLEETCKVFDDLKPLEYVIFESANRGDTNCNYTFKVENDRVDEVVDLIDDLDPRDFSENSYTIKKVVENYTSEVEILQKKAEVIDKTLEEATASYDELTGLATRTGDTETLAKILADKLSIIEKLSNERINNAARLERIANQRAEQLDRLNYTYFYVNVYEVKIVDGQDLKDSWTDTLTNFVDDTNQILQDVSINLLLMLLFVLQYGLYFMILVFAAKYAWKMAKYIWNR